MVAYFCVYVISSLKRKYSQSVHLHIVSSVQQFTVVLTALFYGYIAQCEVPYHTDVKSGAQ